MPSLQPDAVKKKKKKKKVKRLSTSASNASRSPSCSPIPRSGSPLPSSSKRKLMSKRKSVNIPISPQKRKKKKSPRRDHDTNTLTRSVSHNTENQNPNGSKSVAKKRRSRIVTRAPKVILTDKKPNGNRDRRKRGKSTSSRSPNGGNGKLSPSMRMPTKRKRQSAIHLSKIESLKKQLQIESQPKRKSVNLPLTSSASAKKLVSKSSKSPRKSPRKKSGVRHNSSTLLQVHSVKKPKDFLSGSATGRGRGTVQVPPRKRLSDNFMGKSLAPKRSRNIKKRSKSNAVPDFDKLPLSVISDTSNGSNVVLRANEKEKKRRKKKKIENGSNVIHRKSPSKSPKTPTKAIKAVPPRRQKKGKMQSPQKKKKTAPSPSRTEKMCLVRKSSKSNKPKTKKKTLFVINDYVSMSSNPKRWGIIRYKGGVKQLSGQWFGIELLGDLADGDCDGVFNGERYFQCAGGRRSGIFVMYNAIGKRLEKEMVDHLIKTQCNKSGTENKEQSKESRDSKRKFKAKRKSILALTQATSLPAKRRSMVLQRTPPPMTPKSKRSLNKKRKSTMLNLKTEAPIKKASPTQSTTKPAKPSIAKTTNPDPKVLTLSNKSTKSMGRKKRKSVVAVSQTPTISSLTARARGHIDNVDDENHEMNKMDEMDDGDCSDGELPKLSLNLTDSMTASPSPSPMRSGLKISISTAKITNNSVPVYAATPKGTTFVPSSKVSGTGFPSTPSTSSSSTATSTVTPSPSPSPSPMGKRHSLCLSAIHSLPHSQSHSVRKSRRGHKRTASGSGHDVQSAKNANSHHSHYGHNSKHGQNHNVHKGNRSKSRTNSHRRTRSLSVTREDTSWMTHNRDPSGGPKHNRIRRGIEAQKRLDLQLLMKRPSLSKKDEIKMMFAKHIESAKSTPRGDTGDVSKLMERLKNEEEALRNAVDIVADLGFLKYIKDNEVYSRIYIKKRNPNFQHKRLSLSLKGRGWISVNDDDYKNGNGDGKDDEDGNDDDDDDDDDKEGGGGNEGDEYDLFDMNNMAILSQFGGTTRRTLSKVICTAITRIPSLEILEICNCDIDADFLEILVDELCAYYKKHGDDASISILSLQSNPITDRGMMALCRLIRLNHETLTQIKLQNNRRDISTLICQQVCEALEANDYITRFEFAFRHYQWRDHRNKSMKRNAERGRLKRLEMKKEMSM